MQTSVVLLSVQLFVRQSIHLFVLLSASLLSIHLSHPHIHTSASFLSFDLIFCPLIHSNFPLSTCLSIWLPVYPDNYMFSHLSVCPSVRLPIKFLFIQTTICCTVDQLACSSVCQSIIYLSVLYICPSVSLTINLTVWSVCLTDCYTMCFVL